MNQFIVTPTPQSTIPPFQKFLGFLDRMDQAKMPYHISHFREETIALELAVPGSDGKSNSSRTVASRSSDFVATGTLPTNPSSLNCSRPSLDPRMQWPPIRNSY